MSNTNTFARHAVIAATLGLLVGAGVATPASAKERRVTVPARAMPDATSKLCMPRETSPVVAKDKTLPATLCQTREQWAAHGVTIVVK